MLRFLPLETVILQGSALRFLPLLNVTLQGSALRFLPNVTLQGSALRFSSMLIPAHVEKKGLMKNTSQEKTVGY